MKDAEGNEIIVQGRKLFIHENRHRDNDGNRFGWIEGCASKRPDGSGCTTIWSNGEKFNYEAARKFVLEYNNTIITGTPISEIVVVATYWSGEDLVIRDYANQQVISMNKTDAIKLLNFLKETVNE